MKNFGWTKEAHSALLPHQRWSISIGWERTWQQDARIESTSLSVQLLAFVVYIPCATHNNKIVRTNNGFERIFFSSFSPPSSVAASSFLLNENRWAFLCNIITYYSSQAAVLYVRRTTSPPNEKAFPSAEELYGERFHTASVVQKTLLNKWEMKIYLVNF